MKLNEEIKLTKYRISQFKKVKTIFCEYKTKVKFIKPNGETNWLDISNDEFINIVELLTKSKIEFLLMVPRSDFKKSLFLMKNIWFYSKIVFFSYKFEYIL